MSVVGSNSGFALKTDNKLQFFFWKLRKIVQRF